MAGLNTGFKNLKNVSKTEKVQIWSLCKKKKPNKLCCRKKKYKGKVFDTDKKGGKDAIVL